MPMKKIILNFLIVFFAIVFVVSVGAIALYFWQLKSNESYYEGAVSSCVSLALDGNEGDSSANSLISDDDSSGDDSSSNGDKDLSPNKSLKTADYPPVKVDFSAVSKLGDEIEGWLYLPGTPINYPVCYTVDNGYYLHRLPNGNYSYPGSLFFDYMSNPDLSDSKNSIIYGHNMRDGSMFGSLMNYKNQDFYLSHPYLYYITEEKTYRLDVFSAYTTEKYSDAYLTKLDTEKKFDSFLKLAYLKTKLETVVQKEEVEKVVTLSTCDYSFSDARFVVHCRVEEV